MKKIFKSFGLSLLALPLSVSVSAESAAQNAADMNFADILVSALYFVGVLALIYLILTLVSRWGKKHPDKKDGNSEDERQTENNTESTTESIIPEKEKESPADTENRDII